VVSIEILLSVISILSYFVIFFRFLPADKTLEELRLSAAGFAGRLHGL
jgi:hypothetical protein